MHFQVADVHRPLLSLSKAADMGFRSYFDGEGGWLEDMESGDVLPIHWKGDLHVMQLWVRGIQLEDSKGVGNGTPFVRQG